MKTLVKTCAVFATTATVLSGCGAANSSTPDTNATVTLINASTDCNGDQDCWLPTQYTPQLADGQTVSRRDYRPGGGEQGWPSKGDRIAAICQTGEWYQIYVPKDKASADVLQNMGPKPKTANDDGYNGYVETRWVALDKGVELPSC